MWEDLYQAIAAFFYNKLDLWQAFQTSDQSASYQQSPK
jgi:hypothetical protein